MEYEEIQTNEVEALKAIYASDFMELENRSVWNQRPSPKFRIALRPSSEFENSPIQVQIQVTMTQTYPKTLPNIEINKSTALSGRQTETLKQCIDSTVKQLKGSEMIFEVTSNIQAQIDEWARSVSEAAPNLEEDRLRRLRLEERKQKEQQDALQREREVAAIKEEQKYDSLVLEELKKSEATDGNLYSVDNDLKRLIVVPENTFGVTTFGRAIELPQLFSDENKTVVFRQVMTGLKIRQAFYGTSYVARAILPSNNSGDDSSDFNDGDAHSDVALLLSKVRFSSEYWRTPSGARILHDLNNELSLIRQYRHPGILPLCDFMIERFRGGAHEWELTLLTPLSRLTPLTDILDSADSVSLKTAQRWSFHILEALENLHKAGLRHRCLCPDNAVVNVDPETGETSMMLRHPQYLYTLHNLNERHPFDSNHRKSSRSSNIFEQSPQFVPPEGRGRNQPNSPSSKWDIWQFGALLAVMVAGKKELYNFKGDIEAYVLSRPRHWPSDLSEFLQSVLHPDPSKRPGALELLTDQFFRSDFESFIEKHDAGNSMADSAIYGRTNQILINPSSLASDSAVTLALKNPSTSSSLTPGSAENAPGFHEANAEGSYGKRRLSNNDDNNTFSRYKQDFDEGIVLGRGGFGQVVKARNKLDGRVYAVKKIRATPSTLSHILQEVVLLSRLNHQYVVRYYTVWLEDESDNVEADATANSDTRSSAQKDYGGSLGQDSLSGPTRVPAPRHDILDSIPSTSLSQFSAHHSLSELDIPSVSHDFMSDSGFVEFGFSDSDEEAIVDVGNDVTHSKASSNDDDDDDENDDDSETNGTEKLDGSRSSDREIGSIHQALAHGDRNKLNNRTKETLLNRLSRITRKTLYIQMEYCENHTLGDLIRQNLCSNPLEYWRLLRQILEALAYIHGEGVIHRDLKPKNIFIDQARNIKIGDFGLARSMVQPLQSRQHSVEPNVLTPNTSGGNSADISTIDDEDLTTDVGTSLYSAVEITTANYPKRGYNEKVDIFSLGIIFFEMVWGAGTEMERIQNIRRVRMPQIELPTELLAAKELRIQVELIKSMLNHDPSKRPSAMGLLESGRIPVEEQNMTVQEALRNIRDPRIVQQLTNALFSRPLVTAQQVLYDRSNQTMVGGRRQQVQVGDPNISLTMSYVENVLKYVFRAHGAVDNTAFRSRLFPRSTIYKGPTVVELLDSQGTVLQLPHDLTLPHARRLAEVVPDYTKAFAVDTVFRDRLQNSGVHPAKHIEVDFDIISVEESQESLMFDEAETIAVMYDSANVVVHGGLTATNMAGFSNTGLSGFDMSVSSCPLESLSSNESGSVANGLAVIISHHDILSATLSHCGLSPPQYYAALSLLNTGSLDRRGSALLRSNISTASLEMLSQFGFRELLSRAETTMSKYMPLSERIRRGLAHVRSVAATFKQLCATDNDPQIFFSPLMHTATSEFYINGVIFQLVETKSSPTTSRQFGAGSVLAVGGRYDSLVKSFRNSVLDSRTQLVKAVGFGMSADKLGAMVAKQQLQTQQSQYQSQSRAIIRPRCQVLISSLSENTLKTQGLDAVKLLWRYGINADLVRNIVSTEDLLAQAAKESVPLVVIVKQMHALSSTNNKFKPLRVKRLSVNGSQSQSDIDLAFSELVPFILSELGVNGNNLSESEGSGYPPHQSEFSQSMDFETSNDRVIILNESGKLKGGRKNKWQLEERSVDARAQFLSELGNAPVVSLDLRDDVIDAITTVSPHASEDWKRRVVGLSPNQKAYIMNVQAKLSNEATRSPRMLLFSSKSENVFVYNY